MKLRFLPDAFADIERLHAFLAPKNPRAANRVVDIIFAAAMSLRTAPRSGRPLDHGFRELVARFGKGGYVLRYRVDEEKDALIIVRIWHSRERR